MRSRRERFAKTATSLPGDGIPAGRMTSSQTYAAPRIVAAIGKR